MSSNEIKTRSGRQMKKHNCFQMRPHTVWKTLSTSWREIRVRKKTRIIWLLVIETEVIDYFILTGRVTYKNVLRVLVRKEIKLRLSYSSSMNTRVRVRTRTRTSNRTRTKNKYYFWRVLYGTILRTVSRNFVLCITRQNTAKPQTALSCWFCYPTAM